MKRTWQETECMPPSRYNSASKFMWCTLLYVIGICRMPISMVANQVCANSRQFDCVRRTEYPSETANTSTALAHIRHMHCRSIINDNTGWLTVIIFYRLPIWFWYFGAHSRLRSCDGGWSVGASRSPITSNFTGKSERQPWCAPSSELPLHLFHKARIMHE